jgi:hypothetical protein
MTTPGKSAWVPAWTGDKSSALLPASACPKCRGALVRLCGTVACDACDYVAPRLGQRGAPRPPEPPASEPLPNRFGVAEQRQAEALEWLAAHPWSSTVEGAKALRQKPETVRGYWLRGGATRRRRTCSGQTFEYMAPEQAEKPGEAVAC